MLSYLEKNQGSTKYLVAVTSSQTADPIIISTGKPVMALGGFSGNDDILTVSQLAQLVKNGTVRYFLLDGGNQGQVFAPSADMLDEICPPARRPGSRQISASFAAALWAAAWAAERTKR